MRNENGADHQHEDEEDQADHAAPSVAYASRDEDEAPKKDRKEFHGGGWLTLPSHLTSELRRADQKLSGRPKTECDQ